VIGFLYNLHLLLYAVHENYADDEDEPADEADSTDGIEPTQLSLDEDDYDGTNVTALAGK